jgi:alpha-tubulin suppressor-like RCC1 family protein
MYLVAGQLGDGTIHSRGSPKPVAGLRNVLTITAGVYHTCAVMRTGKAYCWGWNLYGEAAAIA